MKDFFKKHNLNYKKDELIRFICLSAMFWGIVSILMVLVNRFVLPVTTLSEHSFLFNIGSGVETNMTKIANVVSDIFQPEVVTIGLVLVGVAVILITKKGKTGLYISITAGVAAVLAQLYKIVLLRPRPNVWPEIATENSGSFPSGHAMMATVLMSIITLLAFYYLKNKWLKMAIAIVSILVILLVSWSRMFLGVHYPTDIIAGIDIGVFWTWIAFLLIIPIQSRNAPLTKLDKNSLK